jgi:hypothetical protein
LCASPFFLLITQVHPNLSTAAREGRGKAARRSLRLVLHRGSRIGARVLEGPEEDERTLGPPSKANGLVAAFQGRWPEGHRGTILRAMSQLADAQNYAVVDRFE